MHILVTGGLGYIGSHVVAELIEAYSSQPQTIIVIIDNLKNSTKHTLNILQRIVSRNAVTVPGVCIELQVVDISNEAEMERAFAEYAFEVVYHLAALKSIPESIINPELYYKTNFLASKHIIDLCMKYRVRKCIFSSSASVYGDQVVPTGGFSEQDALEPDHITHMYGKTKRLVELYMEGQTKQTYTTFIALRYFNPIGNHPEGHLGEMLANVTEHMSLFKVLSSEYIKTIAHSVNTHKQQGGYKPTLRIFGNDYPTTDGTCERDVIHVSDVAKCHVCVAQNIYPTSYCVFNVGQGFPTSIKALVQAYESASGVSFIKRYCEKRSGDAVTSYANVDKIWTAVEWKATRTIESACLDSVTHCESITHRNLKYE